MKRLQNIFNCAGLKIKNYFFNSKKTDIYQECEKAKDFNKKTKVEHEKNQTDEYLKNYALTTRWQTV